MSASRCREGEADPPLRCRCSCSRCIPLPSPPAPGSPVSRYLGAARPRSRISWRARSPHGAPPHSPHGRGGRETPRGGACAVKGADEEPWNWGIWDCGIWEFGIVEFGIVPGYAQGSSIQPLALHRHRNNPSLSLRAKRKGLSMALISTGGKRIVTNRILINKRTMYF